MRLLRVIQNASAQIPCFGPLVSTATVAAVGNGAAFPGERDPHKLAALRDPRVKASEEQRMQFETIPFVNSSSKYRLKQILLP